MDQQNGENRTKTFPLKMSPEFNHKLRVLAAEQGTTIQQLVTDAINEKLAKVAQE
jgi:predicted HicB family RNase H-like nuclease